MVPGSAADLRKHLFPSSWQEHYKLVTVGFAALQGCDEKKARKTSVFFSGRSLSITVGHTSTCSLEESKA